MSEQKLIVMVVLLLALAAQPTVVLAEDDLKKNDVKMEAWAKAMTPGEPHAGLAEMVGEWRYIVTFWEEPGKEPTSFRGVSTKRMVMDGRFLQEELSGEVMERPFRGFGITGFDNVTKQYVGVWLDNMSTGIPYYIGQTDAKGGRSYQSTSHDPVTGRAMRFRSVGQTIDRDHHKFESYLTQPDGTEQLHMRVEYTRVSS